MARIITRYFKFIGCAGAVTTGTLGTYIYYKSNQPAEAKLNLIFDLDETLILADLVAKSQVDPVERSNKNDPNNRTSPNTIAKFSNNRNQESVYNVWYRPFAICTVRLLSKFNNIYLYTAATKNYADRITDEMFPENIFQGKYYRDSLVNNKKDLSVVKTPGNNKILIDDRLKNNVLGQNFYHIPPFKGNFDFEMVKLFCVVVKYNLIGLPIDKDVKRF